MNRKPVELMTKGSKPAGRTKKIFIILLAICSFSVNAQKISFQLVTGLGMATSFGELRAYGISAAVEPKVFIGDHIAAGLRVEGNVLIGGNILADDASEISVGMSLKAAQTIKGEYYFTSMKVRPYAGVGVGRYTMASIGATGAGDASISESSGIGFAPEAGIALGNFRLSAIYNIVPGKDLVNITVGDVKEVSKNYLVLQMSWKIFGIR